MHDVMHRCTSGYPGLMALKAGHTTVPVAALIFHEHYSDLIVQASSRYMRPMCVFYSEFTNTSLTDLH